MVVFVSCIAATQEEDAPSLSERVERLEVEVAALRELLKGR